MGVYGMTYDEFWRDDPWLAKYYREAYVERRKEENRRDWLQGAYFYNAVATALGNAFRKKGQKPTDYISEPLQIFPPTKEEQEAKITKEREKAEAVFKQLIAKQRAAKAAKELKDAETGNT